MVTFYIDTSDKRCACLMDMLKARGFKAEVWQEEAYKKGMTVFSPSRLIGAAEARSVPKGGILFGGRCDTEAERLLLERQVTFFNMLRDEDFVWQNTVPTALGCMHRITEESENCINTMNTLVIGWGRVAKTLAKYLVGLDTGVRVYTERERERAEARALGFSVEDSLSAIGDFGLIINTVPAPLLTKKVSEEIRRDALVCDLASGTNVDVAFLSERGVNAFKAEGLPGKIAPKTGAEYMEKFILKCIEEMKNRGELL